MCSNKKNHLNRKNGLTLSEIRNRAIYIGELLQLQSAVKRILPHLFKETEIVAKKRLVNAVNSAIDHTVLKPNATANEVEKLCKEAIEHSFFAVCVNPCRAALATKLLKGTNVDVAVVVGFPLGATSIKSKHFETEEMVRIGVKEIDMVINVGALKDGDYAYVLKDIQAVTSAAGRAVVKVIVETCLLSPVQIVDACILSCLGGAGFVKTSTGFSTGGASVDNVALMAKTVGESALVKASGGIKNLKDTIALLEAGASRIGTSQSVTIMTEQLQKQSKL